VRERESKTKIER
jgi:hypothetical protein